MTTMTDEQDDLEIIAVTNGYETGVSIKTWEEACEESQEWANQARKRAARRIMVKRLLWIFASTVFIAFILVLFWL